MVKPKWFWGSYAYVYDSLLSLFPYQELMSQVARSLRLKEDKPRVLDAGCGTGNLAPALLAHIPKQVRFHGLECSTVMLQMAQDKLRKSGATAFYLRADLNAPLPYKDSSFDGIAVLNVLYALSNPGAALKEFRRVLKLGGILVLATPRRGAKVGDVIREHFRLAYSRGFFSSASFWRKTAKLLPKLALVIIYNLLLKELGRRRHLYFFDEEGLTGLIKKAGFRILDLRNAYADTDVFVVAAKILLARDNSGTELEVGLAHTEEDFAALYGLRYDTYCKEQEYLNPQDYPDKQERDSYDEHSIHLIVICQDRIVGTMRLIKNSTRGFLLEEGFQLPNSMDRFRTLEHSRAAANKEYRSHGLFVILTEAAYVWQMERGYDVCIGAAVPRVKMLLDRMGWKPFGETKWYHNTTATPMHIRLDSGVRFDYLRENP